MQAQFSPWKKGYFYNIFVIIEYFAPSKFSMFIHIIISQNAPYWTSCEVLYSSLYRHRLEKITEIYLYICQGLASCVLDTVLYVLWGCTVIMYSVVIIADNTPK